MFSTFLVSAARCPLTGGKALNKKGKVWSSPWTNMMSVHLGRTEEQPPPRLRFPTLPTGRGLCSSLKCQRCYLPLIILAECAEAALTGARFWHNDWLQSCGFSLRNPTVATVVLWRLSIKGKTNMQVDGKGVRRGGGIYQRHNCRPVLWLSWATERPVPPGSSTYLSLDTLTYFHLWAKLWQIWPNNVC